MNFVELMELQRTVTACFPKLAKKQPKLQIYDTQNEGYALYIKHDSLDKKHLKSLNRIVKTRNLEMTEANDYIVITRR
jgi:hypothetical protein